GRALVAHLRADLVLLGGLAQLARLEDGVSQRLLAVDVLLELDGHHAGRGVRVVGSGDGDGVDGLAHLVEQLAEVGELRRLGEGLGHGIEPALVDVADGDDIADVAGVLGVALALAADADAGDVQLVLLLVLVGESAGDPPAEAGDGGRLQELTAIGRCGHTDSPLWCAERTVWTDVIADNGDRPGTGGGGRSDAATPGRHDRSCPQGLPGAALPGGAVPVRWPDATASPGRRAAAVP